MVIDLSPGAFSQLKIKQQRNSQPRGLKGTINEAGYKEGKAEEKIFF